MWTDFFVAAAGASSALAGLVFVALSVNLSQIIRSTHLPTRAAATIGMLILILVSSMTALIPQRTVLLGAETLVFAMGGSWLQVLSARGGFAARSQLQRPRWESVLNAVLGQIQILPFVIGAILLLTGHAHGLYWVAGGSIAIFVFSALNAWVPLVEILR
jgi:hypothetical protein